MAQGVVEGNETANDVEYVDLVLVQPTGQAENEPDDHLVVVEGTTVAEPDKKNGKLLFWITSKSKNKIPLKMLFIFPCRGAKSVQKKRKTPKRVQGAHKGSK